MVSTQQIMFWKISKSRWKQLDSNEPIVQRRYAFSFNISICWFQHQMVSTLVMLEILLSIQRILNKVNFELQVQYSMFWTVRHVGDQQSSLCWFTSSDFTYASWHFFWCETRDCHRLQTQKRPLPQAASCPAPSKQRNPPQQKNALNHLQ